MSLTGSEIGEGFFTMPTWIRFLCNVTPSKSVTTTGVVEWFSTMLTHIRLFLQCELFHGCSDDYARKMFFFSTMLACMSLLLPVVWLLLCLLHLLRLLKALPQCSCTRFLCSVAPVMSATTTGVVEGFSTMLTCIMTLCHVYPFMNVTSTGTSEWFSTTYMHKVSLQFEFFHECYKMQNW